MKTKETRLQHHEGIFTAISIGFFFLLVGALFIVNGNLFSSIIDFFEDFTLVDIPHTDVMLFAP